VSILAIFLCEGFFDQGISGIAFDPCFLPVKDDAHRLHEQLNIVGTEWMSETFKDA